MNTNEISIIVNLFALCVIIFLTFRLKEEVEKNRNQRLMLSGINLKKILEKEKEKKNYYIASMTNNHHYSRMEIHFHVTVEEIPTELYKNTNYFKGKILDSNSTLGFSMIGNIMLFDKRHCRKL